MRRLSSFQPFDPKDIQRHLGLAENDDDFGAIEPIGHKKGKGKK